jgi:hypothetical protein
VSSLNDYIIRRAQAYRKSRTVSEDVGEVRTLSSRGLDAATVALPAGISLDDRADRMNQFWRALVEFQCEDVLVVALCSREK